MGVKKALEMAENRGGAGVCGGAGGGEQLELLAGDDGLDPGGALPVSDSPARRRGPGRPKGRPNRRTEEIVRYIGARYPMPLQAICELYTRNVRDLAIELDLVERGEDGRVKTDMTGEPLLQRGALLDVLRVQAAAMQAALPYLHQRQPMAVQATVRQAGMIVIGELGGGEDYGDGEIKISVENQALSFEAPEKSDGEKSDE